MCDPSKVAIFSYLEQPITKILRSRHYLTLNISVTVRDTDIVAFTPSSDVSVQQTLVTAKYSTTRSLVARSLRQLISFLSTMGFPSISAAGLDFHEIKLQYSSAQNKKTRSLLSRIYGLKIEP